MRIRKYLIPGFLTILCLTACASKTASVSKDQSEKETVAPIQADTEIEEKSVSHYDYSEPVSGYAGILYTLGKEDNFAYSPSSLNMALAMYNQLLDDGEEKAEITNYLGTKDYLDIQDSNSIKSVNRIWINSNKDLQTQNFPVLKDYFYDIDMSQPDATEIKNNYVSLHTHGLITSTPTIFNQLTILDVMNVLYFQGEWLNSMDVLPEKDTFKDINGAETDINMIGYERSGSYLESDTAYGCCLYYRTPETEVLEDEEDEENEEYEDFPGESEESIDETEPTPTDPDGESVEPEPTVEATKYPKDPEAVMIVILPKDEDAKLAYIDITPFLPNSQTAESKSADIFRFRMPKFDTNCSWSFDENIANLLNLRHFGEQGISPKLFRYGYEACKPELSQLVRVSVDEKGTKAAAVTEIRVAINACIDPNPTPEPTRFDFFCTHPFIYVIYDLVNDDIAFVGQVTTVEG